MAALAAVAHSAEVHAAAPTVAVHVVVDSAAALAVDSVEVLIAVVHAAADSAVAALAAVVPSAEAHTEVVLTVVDTAVVVAAEWADTDNSEHQFPDFRIRHPRNFAH